MFPRKLCLPHLNPSELPLKAGHDSDPPPFGWFHLDLSCTGADPAPRKLRRAASWGGGCLSKRPLLRHESSRASPVPGGAASARRGECTTCGNLIVPDGIWARGFGKEGGRGAGGDREIPASSVMLVDYLAPFPIPRGRRSSRRLARALPAFVCCCCHGFESCSDRFGETPMTGRCLTAAIRVHSRCCQL